MNSLNVKLKNIKIQPPAIKTELNALFMPIIVTELAIVNPVNVLTISIKELIIMPRKPRNIAKSGWIKICPRLVFRIWIDKDTKAGREINIAMSVRNAAYF